LEKFLSPDFLSMDISLESVENYWDFCTTL
jgi:hypothetical protein